MLAGWRAGGDGVGGVVKGARLRCLVFLVLGMFLVVVFVVVVVVVIIKQLMLLSTHDFIHYIQSFNRARIFFP